MPINGDFPAEQEVAKPANVAVASTDEAPRFYVSSESIIFQVCCTLAAIYYAMLLTNWGSPSSFSETAFMFGSSSEMAYWVQQVAQWITIILFIIS